jgi:D-glycero-beta-D-manno-heptose 1-phosphate adenylyltransferase
MNRKIVPMEELAARAAQLRAAGRKLVATNGCFDLLHLGHVHYLQAARALGNALVVGVNGDASVRKLKGRGRPLNSEMARAEILAALECVDLVAVFPEERASRFIELAAPDVYVKGGDYTAATLNPEERAVLEKNATEIRIIPLEKGYSTSRLLEQLRDLAK